MERQPNHRQGGEQLAEDSRHETGEPTETDAATELAELIELTEQPDRLPTLVEFAHHLRAGVGPGAMPLQYNLTAVKRYQLPGISHEDAILLAGFEYFLREKISHTEREIEQAAFERPTAPQYHPRIYVADLASHNQGIQHGLWIDADQEAEGLQADIEALLASSPTTGAEEYAIHDYDGFAGFEISEHEDLAVVSRVAQGIARHGDAFAAYVQIVGTDDRDLLDRFEDFYVGSYNNPEAWAREVGADLEWGRHLDEVVDPMLRPYLVIDYARFARDQRQNWDVLEGIDGRTHVFMR
jgi:antirestriction protein